MLHQSSTTELLSVNLHLNSRPASSSVCCKTVSCTYYCQAWWTYVVRIDRDIGHSVVNARTLPTTTVDDSISNSSVIHLPHPVRTRQYPGHHFPVIISNQEFDQFRMPLRLDWFVSRYTVTPTTTCNGGCTTISKRECNARHHSLRLSRELSAGLCPDRPKSSGLGLWRCSYLSFNSRTSHVIR